MKRFLSIQLLTFSIVLGAAVSVLVAWGIVLAPRPKGWGWMKAARVLSYAAESHDISVLHSESRGVGVRSWSIEPPTYKSDASGEWTRVPIKPDQNKFFEEMVVDQSLMAPLPPWCPEWPEPETLNVYQTRIGWPFRCLECRQAFSLTTRRPVRVDTLVNESFELPTAWIPGAGTTTELPFRPVWWGLAFNTAIFGTVILMLALGVKAVTRAIRRRLGRCPVCCYDCRDTAISTCPECGTVVCSDRVHAA